MKNRRRVRRYDDVLVKIVGEYAEMPGMRLTAHQAQLLFGLTPEVCMEALNALIDRKFLTRLPDGSYMRLADGTADLSGLPQEGHTGDLKRTA